MRPSSDRGGEVGSRVALVARVATATALAQVGDFAALRVQLQEWAVAELARRVYG